MKRHSTKSIFLILGVFISLVTAQALWAAETYTVSGVIEEISTRLMEACQLKRRIQSK